ncbi:succinate--CoA ligase subunit beta [Solemya pervernicosa gill symbiont]|uniref:Succinate--CoA ligase [ADP-forming] subunit beta n=2 Tax=Gammaproteobacteria incertae sedis TaxID=118884 RepID=A0A1T2L2T1_9GAMM|nr:ADP-forming succinate--CoA ligase subunit beta [Candidatus Reidiella endopervernicosa]OOZ39407.1 succinate--CoA ligase subunit beta [Solemya pervernicosa gill symbiont]QKQ26938.1 ADP-forming succinate--CoA ligase subunit beta [Candidatus Reidiella endopervernicosa]
MNLHEYQAKQLFANYGIPVPQGGPASSPQEATEVAKQIGGEAWVVKAQVHAGGRGKAGGVKLVDSLDALSEEADRMLGSGLATHQTHGRELPINKLIVEQTLPIDRELYLGALVERGSERIVFMASVAGGMDIEEVAANEPKKILTVYADPAAGLQPYQCRKLAFGLGLEGKQIGALTKIMMNLYRLFVEKDLSLVEINPLIVSGESLLALDAKLNVDDTALYRRPDIMELRDTTQEDDKECEAAKHDLNYITLDGNIGCMVNGAGLAMATMDLIKLHGGEPANFLDVGGGTTAERVAEAFKLIVSDSKVQAILVNIFGGIVRCDLIAEGIIAAVKEVGIKVPVIARLEGTNAEQGLKLLAESGLNITAAEALTDAAKQAVASIA